MTAKLVKFYKISELKLVKELQEMIIIKCKSQ